MKIEFRSLGNCILALAAIFAGGLAQAQGYPAKPVRLILGAPAGGGADVILRPFAPRLSEQLGQQVIIDNRPGAGSMIAGQIAIAAPADGYTLLQASASGFSVSPFLQKKLPYDPERDFVPVTMIAKAPMMITVNPALQVRSVKDLVALGKAKQKQVLYASNGQGSFSHLTTELFSSVTGVRMTHVPYKG